MTTSTNDLGNSTWYGLATDISLEQENKGVQSFIMTNIAL